MPKLNTTCKICHNKFRSSDVIYSTFCGHIFHKSCLYNWKLSEINCPICKTKFVVGTYEHELFLELDDQEEKSKTKETIKVRKNSRCGNTITIISPRTNPPLYDLSKEDFRTSETSKQEHEQKITNLKQSIQELSIETKEQKPKELDFKNIDITKQHISLLESDDDNIVLSESILQNQIKILEQKLEHLSEELEEEISIAASTIEKLTKRDYTNIHTDNYFVIENFPVNQVLYPLENTIIYVGAKIRLNVSPDDICKVRMLAENEWQQTSPDKITLLVEFKSNRLKIKFFANEHILSEYLSPSYTFKTLPNDAYALLVYANEKLKNCGGFKTIDKEVDKVNSLLFHVNADDNEGRTFRLYSRKHVDKLLERYINDKTFNALMAEKGLQKH